MLLKKEMSKAEIEKELNREGDYVQIDTIRRFLKENPSPELKKLVCIRLAEIYERRMMFPQAAETYNKLADMTNIYADKMKFLIQEAGNYIHGGFFEMADSITNKIIAEVKPMEKTSTMNIIKDFYRTQAQIYEKEKRKSKAVQIYEKLVTSKTISDAEKSEIDNKLLRLYNDLGLVSKYLDLKGKLEEK
jgi:tetratricopeptide (TPR) repeat protein